ncbi:ribosome hibernation-promoting factor, HPF/YfiA family [Candidatus Nitrotoga sp. AM1P]|uniref:ribosome hibernation-promoting factor, HPF/YfiA family n=1 Tax=Candidatus Nitrotoga sp. AM1P TaxID=2559597 RepID=UPI0010BC6D79|nr:ribosome-associated translation inhibitor RaiA [Candidatus Nitrotoga sp. AM1P]BBJ23957.1 ribosomal subunit interface protein [Candidatus Nitrotoga sp. AM1P]
MNLNLSGHHLEITPAIREHVVSKLGKIERHFDNMIDVNVILSVEKLKQKAEANVHLSGKTIFVESDDTNLYVAIDNLIEKLDRQIIKHKEKQAARRHDESGNPPAVGQE